MLYSRRRGCVRGHLRRCGRQYLWEAERDDESRIAERNNRRNRAVMKR
jgi:hypothetical protein